MASKPTNHVTRDIEQRLYGYAKDDPDAASKPCPEIPLDLLQWLEAANPASCFNPDEEVYDQHLVRAGKVSLVAHLRALYEEQQEEALAEDRVSA